MFFHFLLGNSTNKYFILWVEKISYNFFTSNIIEKYCLNAAFLLHKNHKFKGENSFYYMYSTLIIQLFFNDFLL